MALFIVDLATDTDDGTMVLDNMTLRKAIRLANLDADADTIQFASGVGDAFENGGLIRLTGGQIEITQVLTIDGSTAGGELVITGDRDDDDLTLAGTDITDVAASGAALLDDNSRLFLLSGADSDTTFTGLTLTGGRTTGNFEDGGAVDSFSADVTLMNSRVSGNSTAGDFAEGGGISAFDATLTNSTVSGNSTAGSGADGGGISARFDVTLTSSTVSGNSTAGGSAPGGGIFALNDATLTNSTVSGNSTAGGSALGGGINANTAMLTNSTVSGNSTAGDFSEGGGIRASNATLTNSTVSGNSTAGDYADGGGISVYTATLTNSTVSGNSTAGDIAVGGGIIASVATLTNSTVSGNSTAGDYGYGGGIFASTATLTNSTVSGNSTAGDFAVGGGIFTVNATLTNSLVIGNVSAQTTLDETRGNLILQGGNIVGGTFTLDGVSSATGITAADIFAATTETLTDGNGDGAPEAATGVFGGVLADNGGPVQTIALLADAANPALDAGNDAGTDVPALDARGVGRFDQPDVANNAANISDLGAFEATEFPSLVVTTTADVVDAADGETSLREAVAFANSNADASIITFASDAGDAFENDALIRLTEGEIVITQVLTIDGSTAGGELVITGDKDNDDITLAGTDITDVAASGAALLDDNSRLFLLSGPDADTTFTGLTLTGGRTTGGFEDGGAVDSPNADVTLTNSTVSGNSTAGYQADGGGIFAVNATLTNSTVSGNSTGGNFADGGGILASNSTLTNSTVSSNSTTGDYGYGGGIFASIATLTNSTVSGNSTVGTFSQGGGIQASTATLTNSTVSGNSTAGDYGYGGGIYASIVTLTNSLVIGNVSADTADDETNGSLILQGGNIIGDIFSIDGATQATGITAADIFAATTETLTDDNGDGAPETATGVFGGVLADNGGPVQTIALLADAANPALDVGGALDEAVLGIDLNGDGDTNDVIGADANGDDRTVDLPGVGADGMGFVDAGAVELQVLGDLTVTLAAAEIIEAGGATTGTVTRSGASTTTALTVTLTSSDTTEATVPASVIIGIGETSATFAVAAVDDGVTDGDQPVTITATAATINPGSATLTVVENAAPTITLDPATRELPEDVDVTVRVKLADVVIADDGIGTNNLSIRGADSGSFELDGTELFIKAGAVLDFEREAELEVFVDVDDPAVGVPRDDTATFTLELTDVNEAPEVLATNVTTELPEDTDTSAAVKVADLEIVDDALGTNALSLNGADAGLFSIVGNELFLNAGAALDFETQARLAVTVDVDDTTVGATPDDSVDLVIAVGDVNEAPAVSLANVIAGVSETSFLGGRVKVADLVVTDDALGTNALSLTGPNRFLFQLDGNELYIRAGQALDFESQNPLDVTVVVGDPSLPGQTDSVVASLTLLDVNEAPSGVSVIVPDVEVPEDTDTTEPVKVADIVIGDDAVGDNMLSLSGDDAGLFEVVGTELFLIAGAALDFETNPDLQVTVTLDDPNFAGIEGTADVTIAVGDVNEPPTLALLNPLADLPEDVDTSARIKVADIDASDDALGSATLALSGADAALFEIDGAELFLSAGAALDFETNPGLDVVVTVDDPTLGTDVEDTAALSLAITDVDEPATLALTPVVTELAEDTDTAARIKVADITITDDALGTNTLALAGADAALFEIDGAELFLIAGTALDFETTTQLDVAVTLEGTDESAPLSLAITDVDEPPTLALLNALSAIAEDADTTARIKVADINVSDDALGTATLGLTGADAALFEIGGAELFLSAGAALDFESAATLEVSVTVDDPALGVAPDDSAPLSLAVSDANEAPTLALTPVLSELGDDADTTARIKVADIAITDDALGTNTLALVGADAALFEIDGTELFVVAGAALTAATLDIAVTLDDPDFAGLEGSAVLALSITQTNAAPAVALSNVIADLDEDTDTTTPVFVADITITDDTLGTNTLSLGGADAALFEITGTEVFLKAGTVLDFETLASLAFEVNVDDATVGATPDDSAGAAIAVNDVNEAPSLTITPTATEVLSSKAPVAERQLVATIAITDDALGTADLALAGADGDLFEIDGMELFLKGGLDLQGRTASDLEVDVSVDDPALGAGVEDTSTFNLPVINVYFPGTPEDDLLIGTQFADLFEGFASDDTLVALGEGDTLDGGAGKDTATLAAPQENHTITFGADGTLVEDRTEAGGPDTLIDMEALLFADDRLAAPTEGTLLNLTLFDGVLDVTEAQLAALSLIYIGFYDRAPDAPGLFYWATQLANGMSLEDIAQEFLDAPELVAVFGETPDTMKLVTTAYNNLLDRDEDATGSTFWNDLVANGVIGADEFLFLFAAGTDAGGSDRQILQDQTDIGLHFSAIQGLSDTTDATAALAAYDADDREASLQAAQTLIDGFVADVEAGGEDAALLMRVTGILDDPFAVA